MHHGRQGGNVAVEDTVLINERVQVSSRELS